MNRRFNRSVLTKNISYLLKKQEKKIGEFEAAVGVSPGYVSRMSREGGTRPGIEFIVDAARELNVGIDILLCTDLSVLSPAEQYLVSFLEKLKNDTISNRLNWEKAAEDDLFLSEICDGDYTTVKECFSVPMTEDCALYACRSDKKEDGKEIIKVWILMKGKKAECLCTTDRTDGTAEMVSALYSVIMDNVDQPRISRDIRNIIDAFMSQDPETDEI